ncbi:MAG: PadR family transcriptional regulator [Actinomycetota bacterium]|nr:PadR family transcriptional regulator [Actinomycetota bacterium]
MLELAILGLLKEQELHGYELKKRLADTVGPGNGASFGSIYPALGRLERAGAVGVVRVHGGAGRGKKVYAITDRGDHLFEELLAADAGSSEDERSFNLRLAFARHLSRDARIGLLERRRAYLLERLARTRGAIRHGWGRLDAYTRSLIEHGNETTERDISWLDRLIAREREEASSGVSESNDAGPAVPVVPAVIAAPWAASAPPTMPVRPAAGPFVPSSSHPRGGNIR